LTDDMDFEDADDNASAKGMIFLIFADMYTDQFRCCYREK